MGDDRSKPPPLERRVPGATRAGPASPTRPELPEALLQRMQAVVKAAHAQAMQEEAGRGAQPDQDAASQAPASLPKREPGAAGAPKPSNGMRRPKEPTASQGRLSDEDAEFDTDPFLPRVTASGTIASSPVNGKVAQPDQAAQQNHRPQQNHTAQQGDTVKPGHALKQDRALRRRDRRATKRDRAEQAERERAERERQRERAAQAERAEQERAERERAEQERAAQAERERAEQERAAQAERERAEQERAAQAERERAEQERAAQAERERAEQERAAQAERERAEQERAAQAERERAEQERAAQAERERAEQERAAQAERERAEQERAAQAERERAEQERAAQAERERAEQERAAQAERERAEQERAAQAERERAVETEQTAQAERATQAERELAAEAAWAEREHAAQAEHEHAAQADREPLEQAAAAENPAGADQGVAERAGQPQRTAPSDQAEPGHTASPTSRAAAAVRAPVDLLEPPRPSGLKTPGRRRHRMAAWIAVAAVALAAGPLALVLSRHSPTKLSAAEIARNQAAAWVAQQVSSDAVVSCDVTMCLALKADGVSTGDLLVIGPQARDLLRSQVIVSTAAIRNLFGRRLASAYAPMVLASFGSGKARIDVRVIAPDGAASYLSALKADWQQRKTIGHALATAPQITLTPTARRQMDGGQVDIQLLLVLTNLAAIHSLDILAFGDATPGASPGIPLRCVYLAEKGGTAVVHSLLGYLHQQQGYFRAARAETTQFDAQSVLFIEYDAPSPLLPPSGSGS